jgi:hypothetical protein
MHHANLTLVLSAGTENAASAQNTRDCRRINAGRMAIVEALL